MTGRNWLIRLTNKVNRFLIGESRLTQSTFSTFLPEFTWADGVLLIEDDRILADTRINLPRPREKDSSFAYYEKQLLDRLMARSPQSSQAAI